MKLPKKLKDQKQAEKFFNALELRKINELWGKSYGAFIEAKNGKQYFISYNYAKGHNAHLNVKDFSNL